MRRFSKRWVYPLGLFINDLVVIYLSFWTAYQIRFFCEPFLNFFPANKGIPPWELYQEALRVVVPLWLFVFAFWGRLYQSRFMEAADEFLLIVKATIFASTLMFSATFLYREYEYSRLVMLITFFVSIAFIFISREFWKVVLGHLYENMLAQETVILLGEGKSVETIEKLMKRDRHKNLLVYNSRELENFKKSIADDASVREVYVTGELIKDEKLEELLDECEEQGVEIKIVPELLEMRMGEVIVDNSLRIPILHLKPLSLHGFRYFVKRFFDVSICIAILSILLVPFLVVSLLIVLDSKGGIFFKQERVGFKGKIFNCFKFRTMYQDAESRLKELNLSSFRGGTAFKMKGDPRVTRVGQWLRKFSLDELAQIWNILKGEMSLIGPRPQVLTEANGNPEWAKKRYRILPGITGLWQVSGRADLLYEEMMRLDIYYLENWSPGLDLKILLKTIPVVLSGKGAY